MPVADPKAPGSLERETVAQMLKDVGTLSSGYEALDTQLKDIAAKIAPYAEFDLAAAKTLLDEHTAAIEDFKSKIKSSKDGTWFPGSEDVSKKFSLLRACIGHINGGDKAAFERAGGGYEFEVIKASRDAASQRGAGQVVGITSTGGTFIPDQAIPDVIAAIYTRSVFANLAGADGNARATVLDGLFGLPVKIPRFFGGAVAYWIGEEDEYVQSKLRTGTETMSPKKLGVMLGVTDEMRRFAVPAFDSMMRMDMIRSAAKKLDWTVMYGTGTNDMPLGVANRLRHGTGDGAAGTNSDGTFKPGVNWYWTQTGQGGPEASVPSAPGADFDFTYDDLMNMQGVLEDLDIDIESSFAYVTHPRVWRRAKQFKILNFSGQSTGQPYLIGAPMLSNARLRDIIGDFDKTTQIPTTDNPGGSATAKYGGMFWGNFQELVIGRWSGVEIEDDDGKGLGFNRDITHVKLRLHADVGVREQRALGYTPDVRAR